MKFLALLAFIPGTLLASPLAVTINLDGISAGEISVESFFVARNPVCKSFSTVPNPRVYSRLALNQGEVETVNNEKVIVKIPTEFAGTNFCKYRFDHANVNLGNRMERISIFSVNMRDLSPDGAIPSDIIANKNANLTAECENGRCHVLHNGSITGYTIGHIAHLYVDAKELGSNSAPESEINLSLK